MDLLAWVLLVFFGWGSVPTAVRTPGVSVSAPSNGNNQVQAMHDGTPIPPN
jgi:hypothetical protein